MLEVKILTAQIELNPTDLHSVLSLLSQEGWKPLLFDADANFAKLAGLHENMDFFEFRQSLHLHLENFPFIVGDIFFRDTNEVYYLAAITDNVIPPPDLDDYGLFFDNDFDKTPIVEVGVLSSSPDDLSERLKAFADSVMEAIGTISNRSTENGGKFEWQESTLITSQLDRIKFVLDTESHTRFKGARLVPSEVQAACVLATRLNREILIELNKARFVLRKDVLSKRYKNQIQIHKALEELVASGLIITEREGYSVTDLGKLMASGSHWMTVWVTDLLMKLGIPEQAILWNIFEHGEEVDLLVEFLEQLWILELKDKEFGSGNAYSLNYRQVRYRATRAIVITTEKVSTNAKRVFRTLQGYKDPTYVEGLEKAENALSYEITLAYLEHVTRRLQMIGSLPRYDLVMVLRAKFGKCDLPEARKMQYYS